MMEEYLAESLEADQLSGSLNEFGRQGWLLVNCWPATKKSVMCVFKRSRLDGRARAAGKQGPLPPRQVTPEIALERCLAQPVFKRRGVESKFERSMAVEKLGAEFGLSEADVVRQLREAGFSKSTTTEDCFAAAVSGYNVWVHRKGAERPWILYTKPIPELPAEAETGEIRAFSVAEAIKLCLEKQPKKGMDHSLSVLEAAKIQGTGLSAALAAFKAIGLPTKDHQHPEKRYIIFDGRQVALRAWDKVPGSWFLNIRRAST